MEIKIFKKDAEKTFPTLHKKQNYAHLTISMKSAGS